MLLNINAAHFCDVFLRHRAVLPSCLEKWSRKLFVNISGLYISWGKLEAAHRVQTTNRIPELPTDIHFLDFSETCLYMCHFGLGSVFSAVAKNCLRRSTVKVDQNVSNRF